MSQTPSRVRLTAGRVEAFSCPLGKSQAFLWDTDVPALVLRATPTGRKTYAFEARLNGATVRIGIGTASDWSLGSARTKASDLKRMVDSGIDPREVERQQQADAVARQKEAEAAARTAAREAVTVGEAWTVYL